ncbi:MAG: hypothetical protein FWD90_07130 [Defluviitaleaceae bacterium]|nr:hypothetical protein [Defluviitaleaceae bacterium]
MTSLTRTSDGNGRENARLQATGVTIPNRSVSPLTQERGWLRITGAQLVPEADYTVRNENLRVTLNVTRNSASILHDIGMNEAVFTAAVQEIRDTRISSSVARVIESGVLSADIPGANDWDDEDDLAKTAVITLTEQAANSLMNAPVMIQINTPGVSIAGARARHTNNDGDWPDDDAWPTGITTMAPSMVIIDNPVGSGNRARARTAEIQLILQVAPGLGGIDIPAVVTIMTYPDTITSTEVIATIVDPIELSVDEVREIPVRNNAEFTFLPARRLGSVTVTPRNADVFKVDDVFNVFLRAVDAEGNAFSLPGLSMTWNVTAEVGGELFEVREGVPFNVPANFSSMLPHRIDGQQFEVSRVGTQVPSITFHSTLTGAMINEPGIQFELVVLGSAVQEHDQANVATTIVPMSLRAPYRIVVGKLVGELVLGEYEEEAAPPPPAPTPAPTPEPVVNEPARLDVNTAAVNSAGQPIFITSGDRTLVNLRGLFQDVLPNGSVTRADSISTFAAPSADGPMVQIMIPDPRLNEEPFIRTGGVPVPARVAAGFGLVAIDETWYVPMTVFTDLLGYLIN